MQFKIYQRAMNTLSFITLFVMLPEWRPVGALDDFFNCHEDFTLKPPDGLLKKNTFGWLGFMHYIHVTTGLPHHSTATRVILIHSQFVVGPGKNLLQLPANYKLSNVIFGEYERGEEDCSMTRTQLKEGWKCPPAYYETSYLNIIPHPEYSRFGVQNSLALVKLIGKLKSLYMIPICLPSIDERVIKKKNKFVFMVDYISSVPSDLNLERMAKKTVKLLTHIECRHHRKKSGLKDEGLSHMLCTSGCGVRPGAPIVSQNVDGGFELIGISAGGASCSKRSMRRRFVTDPPLFIDVYPYSTWIVNVITANELPLPYPVYFRRSASGTRIGVREGVEAPEKPQKSGWRSHVFVSGDLCYKSKKKQKRKASFFYKELFVVHSEDFSVNVNMTISAGIDCTIVCARLRLPNNLITPVISGVGRYNITVIFSTEHLPYVFFYTLGLMGRNTTQKNLAVWLQERQPW